MFRDRLNRFLIGRNGVDQLSRFCLYISLLLVIITWFTHQGAIYVVALLFLGYSYFRIMSRNISQRYLENQRFLQIYDRIAPVFVKTWNRVKSLFVRSPYRIYTCPSCKQKVRVPRGRGRIEISCPRCRNHFIKRT